MLKANDGRRTITCSDCQRNGDVKRLQLQSSCNGLEEKGECKETPVFINGVDHDGHRRLMRLVFILLFNIMQNQVLALQEKVDSDTMICDAERV